MNQNIQVLDVVALLEDIQDYNLQKGQVGTIVETLDNSTYEVEFSDNNGVTYSTLALHSSKFIVLHYELAKAD